MIMEGDNVDAALDGHVAGMMHATGINDDDDEMEEVDGGSQDGIEIEG